MFNREVKIGLLLLFSLFCNGCFGGTEPDQLAYVAAIGIDKADKEGMYNFSYQIDNSKNDSSGGGGGGSSSSEGGGAKSSVVTVQAASLAEARNLLNSFLSFRVTLTHIKAFIISDEVAKDGIGRVLAPIMRFREYRGTMYVMIAKDNARKFMESYNPLLKLAPSKYYEWFMITQEGSGYYLDTSLHQVYARMKSQSAQPYATFVGVGKQTLDQEPATGRTGADKTYGYLAGQVPHSGRNPLEFVGTAVFRGDKMVGALSTTETRMFSFLSGFYNYGYLIVQDPLSPKDSVNVRIRPGASPDIKGFFVDGKPAFKVKIEIEGEITGISSGINYEADEYMSLLENQIKQTMEEEIINLIKKTQMMDSDIVGFGFYLRPYFNVDQEFRDYYWLTHYREAVFEIEVNAKIRRTGLMIKTKPIL